MAKKSKKVTLQTEISLGIRTFITGILLSLGAAGILASAFHFPLSKKVSGLESSVSKLVVSNAAMTSELNTLNRILLRKHAFEMLNNGDGTEIVKLTSDGVYKLQRGINYVAVPKELEALAFRPNDLMFAYKTLANAASFRGQYNEETGEGLPNKLKEVWASGMVPLAVNCEAENASVEVGNNVAKLFGCKSFPPYEAAWEGNHVMTSTTLKDVDMAWAAILGGEAAFIETEIGAKWVNHNGGVINLDVFVNPQ